MDQGDDYTDEDCQKLLGKIKILSRQARSQIGDFKAVDDVNDSITTYGYVANSVDTALGMVTSVRGFFKNIFKSKKNWDNLAPRENFPAFNDAEYADYMNSLYETSVAEAAGKAGWDLHIKALEGYVVEITGFSVIDRLSEDLWMRSDAFAKELELNLKDTQYEQHNLQSEYNENCIKN